MASFGADVTPVVGSAKSIVQLITGKDLVTGENVSRPVEALGVFLGLFGAKVLVKGEEAITLFRAVDKAELSQIQKTGTFEVGPNSLGGKFFAESSSDAKQWGDKLNGKGNYTILKVQLPKLQADELMRWPRLDNIGPARYGELEQLSGAIIKVLE